MEEKRQRELETKIESCVSGSELKITVKIVSTWPEMSIAERNRGNINNQKTHILQGLRDEDFTVTSL